MKLKKKTSFHTTSPSNKVKLRERLKKYFNTAPLSIEELLINLNMFSRSSAYAKHLFLFEIYEKILRIPGNIHVYGLWYGQDLVSLYNLREILEPHNVMRKTVGFDTFKGYMGITNKDRRSGIINETNYRVENDYVNFLQDLMQYHEEENSISNIKKFKIIKGDLSVQIKKYMQNNPQELIALAYFDLAIYKPTKACLDTIENHLVSGSCIVFDQLNNSKYPGETIALKNSRLFKDCKIQNSKFLPDRTILVKK